MVLAASFIIWQMRWCVMVKPALLYVTKEEGFRANNPYLCANICEYSLDVLPYGWGEFIPCAIQSCHIRRTSTKQALFAPYSTWHITIATSPPTSAPKVTNSIHNHTHPVDLSIHPSWFTAVSLLCLIFLILFLFRHHFSSSANTLTTKMGVLHHAETKYVIKSQKLLCDWWHFFPPE